MRIQLSGRLGNQLFEVAHGLTRAEDISSKPQFFWDRYSYPEGISTEIASVETMNIIESNSLGLCLKILDKTRKYSKSAEKQICKFFRIEREHNSSVFSHPCLVTGFYQDFQWAESAYVKMRELFSEELLDLEDLKEQSKLPDIYQVLHYRSGDYVRHPGNFGILSFDYYKENLNQNLPVVILTDSLAVAEETFSSLENVLFIDPNQIDAWGAISIIANASHVVSSNSTLSWWGGFFAMKSGAKVVIPEPFFANGSDVNLYHPNFAKKKSFFESAQI